MYGLVYLPLLADPERFAQLSLENFPSRRARQRVDEVDRARHLVAGDALAGEVRSIPRA